MSTSDFSELRVLSADLERAGGRVGAEVAKVVKRGAQNIKADMVQESTGIGHAPHFPRTISYDIEGDDRSSSLSAGIGPDKDRPQGALGNILAFGTSNNAPVFNINAALDREEPKFLNALADALASETIP